MKLATFVTDQDDEAVGVVDIERKVLVDVQQVHVRMYSSPADSLTDMQALIEHGRPCLELVGELVGAATDDEEIPLADVRLAAPLPRPPQIRDFLLFEQHLANCLAQQSRTTGITREIPGAWYSTPAYYRANPATVVGPETDVRWPSYSQVMDFELEMACIIGQRGRDIAVDDAPNHVFGFTIFNDASARDEQMRAMEVGLGPGKGKDFDTGNVLGPWIVTADEVGNPQNLTMTVRVNGEEWGRGTSADMRFTWAEVIADISRAETLHPGEVLGSGTVGTGCGLEHGRFLEDGDVVELDVERIGILRNRFVR